MKIFDSWFDPCPLDENPKFNGLEVSWGHRTYVNPPYSNPLPWVEKAIEESKKGKTIIMLLNVDTSTKWFAKLNEAKDNQGNIADNKNREMLTIVPAKITTASSSEHYTSSATSPFQDEESFQEKKSTLRPR